MSSVNCVCNIFLEDIVAFTDVVHILYYRFV